MGKRCDGCCAKSNQKLLRGSFISVDSDTGIGDWARISELGAISWSVACSRLGSPSLWSGSRVHSFDLRRNGTEVENSVLLLLLTSVEHTFLRLHLTSFNDTDTLEWRRHMARHKIPS